MRRRRTIRYLVYSQLSLYAFLLICVLLLPHFLFERNEGGVSNYGVHARTVAPYSLGFGLSGLLMIRAARELPTKLRRLRFVLSLIGALFLLVLLTTYPYKLNSFFDALHILSAQIIFVAELLAGIWFAICLRRDSINIALLSLQALGSLLALLTLIGVLHILFITQLITGLAFASLMIRTVAKVV